MADRMTKKKTRAARMVVGILLGAYTGMRAMGKKKTEPENIDDENPYLSYAEEDGEGTQDADAHMDVNFYESRVKPLFDHALSFAALVLLSPLFLGISAAIYLDDPGPVFFTQKRVGKDRHFFLLHKFRSMKMGTPHDVPTHMLADPEQYITRVGRFLRKSSLDELPQVWDIFRGKMSVIGPRPALWNQMDLVSEREKYGANAVLPGLTGLAQIRGRDELEIPDKAKLDGEYTVALRKSSVSAVFTDIRCFFGTVASVAVADGVVEGGTGGTQKPLQADDEAGFGEYGHLKHFSIDLSRSNKKKVLITGAGSYIGESFERWASTHYGDNFTIHTLDMKDPSWRETDFSSYDSVFHVAGIAHADVKNVSAKTRALYYAVNTDLAVEAAKKSRESGVKQFIFMSSMIVYGESACYGRERVIDERTMPAPADHYGNSKWLADKRVRGLQGPGFHVAALRLPMVYGRGSKGNYPILAKIARKLPVFPDVKNSRSMLHIDNLCEFLCKLMLDGGGGVYFPQNGEYTRTSAMVEGIADAVWHPIHVTRLLAPAVWIASRIPGRVSRLVDKAFGNMTYAQTLSAYDGLDYQIRDLKTSIELTESIGDGKK